MDGSEAGGDLLLIQTFLLYYVNQVVLMLINIFKEGEVQDGKSPSSLLFQPVSPSSLLFGAISPSSLNLV